MAKVRGAFELTSWDEQTYEEMDDGAKLTRATVAQKFTGGIEGVGSVQWLMCYRSDGTAHFVGLQRVRGILDEREGSFVLETIGDFDGKMATWAASVVPGSGTDGLSGLSGEATFGAPHGSKAVFELTYRLEPAKSARAASTRRSR